jgi:hypothetical protein
MRNSLAAERSPGLDIQRVAKPLALTGIGRHALAKLLPALCAHVERGTGWETPYGSKTRSAAPQGHPVDAGLCETSELEPANAPAETPRIKQEAPKSWKRRRPSAYQPFITDAAWRGRSQRRGVRRPCVPLPLLEEGQSLPVVSLSRFGTVSDRTDWLALTGFLVELFTMRHFWTQPEESHPLGSASCEVRSSPCQTG